MIFIIIVAIIVYLILIAWTWHNLDDIEKNKKIIFTIIGLIAMYVITLIIFQISKSGVLYQNIEMQNDIQNILVIVFTGINGIIVMPQIARILEKINKNEIEKNVIKRNIIILVIIFIGCLMFENGYMKDTQEGILEIYNSMK